MSRKTNNVLWLTASTLMKAEQIPWHHSLEHIRWLHTSVTWNRHQLGLSTHCIHEH